MKKPLALLLILAMVLSLTACSLTIRVGRDEDDAQTEQTVRADADAEDASLRAFAERYDDFLNLLPTLDTAGLLEQIAPELPHAALAELLGLVYAMGVYDEETFFDELDMSGAIDTLPETYGEDYHVETTMRSAEPFTDEQMEQVQAVLKQLRESYTALAALGDGASDADWESAAAADGVTVEQEKRMIELCGVIRDALDACEITEGYSVQLRNEATGSLYDGTGRHSGQISVIRVNGEWMLLDGLVAFLAVHKNEA